MKEKIGYKSVIYHSKEKNDTTTKRHIPKALTYGLVLFWGFVLLIVCWNIEWGNIAIL